MLCIDWAVDVCLSACDWASASTSPLHLCSQATPVQLGITLALKAVLPPLVFQLPPRSPWLIANCHMSMKLLIPESGNPAQFKSNPLHFWQAGWFMMWIPGLNQQRRVQIVHMLMHPNQITKSNVSTSQIQISNFQIHLQMSISFLESSLHTFK